MRPSTRHDLEHFALCASPDGQPGRREEGPQGPRARTAPLSLAGACTAHPRQGAQRLAGFGDIAR
jgi:hypothetical protein